ncbi:MAG: sugar kinase [Scytolyngbya sp. HA4215-MV1]|nr:sugar kinase [Scytolyngbya sp. HA4215-MV1]
MKRGLFVGLVTMDLIYRVDQVPSSNQKIVASDYKIAAGGPATNAAVAFSHLGDRAVLLSLLGQHPITQLIRADLAACGVTIADLMPARLEAPPVSSILVTESTGDRAVVSLNAQKTQACVDEIPPGILQDVAVVMIDAHQMTVGRAIATQAKALNIPVVADCGSWKPGFETVLPLIDYAVCSANFLPPGCSTETAVIDYLSHLGIAHIAITHGEQPIHYVSAGGTGWLQVSQIQAVDTLGAGDIFHGAFCHYLIQQDFVTALDNAASIASRACQFFGTREWMEYSSEATA